MPSLDTWFFGPLRRKMARWRINASQHSAMIFAAERKLELEEQVLVRTFAVSFICEIDADDDGGLSLCELKSAELSLTGASS